MGRTIGPRAHVDKNDFCHNDKILDHVNENGYDKMARMATRNDDGYEEVTMAARG